MRRTEKWEGVGPYLWGNRLMQDEATGDLRLWYIGYDFDGNFYRWGYAQSRDGLHWVKPNLGVEKLGKELASNCLPLGPHPEKGTRSIARDPRPETPSHRRYLGVRFTYEGEFVSFSPDGITWAEYPLNPVWLVPSDIIHVMFDERRNHFTAYFKIWEVSGTQIISNAPAKRFVGYMPSYDLKNANGTAAFSGPLVLFRTNEAAQVIKTNFILRAENQSSDDGGGASLAGAWTAKRVQCWAESDDGIRWRNERVVLAADDKDPPTSNIQYMFVMPYGSYYLGFLTMHDVSGAFRIQLGWSADGLKWTRQWREPWLDIGPEGSFDCGMVLGPADPILFDREMWFPYGGFPIRHDSSSQNWESAIGMATTRLDGFGAWTASESMGELVTQPFVCSGDRLFINADAQGGSLQVEILENGKPLRGFEVNSCRSINTDTLTSPENGWTRWKRRENLASISGKTIQLRFVLKNAKLYSFRVADQKSATLPSPRATKF